MSEKVKDIQTVDKKETTGRVEEANYPSQYKYYIVIALFVIFIIAVVIFLNTSETKNNTESYKPNVVRTDPYDDYDIETDIDKLLNKQEKYLNTLNK